MNGKEILTLAFRIIGVWAVVLGVAQLPFSVIGALHLLGLREVFVEGYPIELMLPGFIEPLIDCILGMVLLLSAPRLAKWFVREPTGPEPARVLEAQPVEWLRIGMQLLGVYALLQAVPSVATAFVWLGSDSFRQARQPSGIQVTSAVLYLACALVLLVGGRRIAEFVVSLRNYPEAREDRSS